MSGSVDRGCGLAVNQSRRTIGYACVLTFALLTAATTPALADVGPPVKVRLLKETTTKPATSGADYSTVIEVVAGADGTIDSFKLSGEGWDIRSVGVTTPRAVRAGEMIPIRFNARPADSEKPLRVSLTFNGRTIKQTFLFSAKRFEEGSRDGASVRIDALTPAQTLAAATEAMDRRAASSSDPNPPPVDEGDEGVPRGDSLRVFGRLVYQRSDGMILGADAMWFQIMDEDDVSDEAMASGFTNANGEFDITFEWDDCDVGCDDPDVYIRWETDNEVVNVQRADLLEEDYSWSTADDRWDDFTGPFIDFGTLMPADLGQHPAIHIHNTINKAHHFILLHDGTDLVEVDALWPEGETGAYYDGTDQEIHIGINQQWIEGTIIHEYGHHYINNHATPWQPDYCNDFCDTDEDDCGHCGWCMETDHDAWSEGWPNWLGGAVMRTYNAYYNYTPLSINDGRYNVEMLGTCGQDNQAHPADITEAYLTAMLQDIEDLPNPPSLDDHDGGAIDCEMDAMALGFDEIFLVTRLDRPTSPLDFINKWRARYPQYDQDFWSTARNVAAIYGDFAAPTPIILAQPNQGCGLQREGESLALSVTGNGALLKYQWRKNLADLTNGGAISGADTNALLINPVQPNHGGMYDCVVITCDGTLFVISEPVHVHVFPAPGNGFQVSGFGRNDAGQLGNGVLGWPTFPAPYVREVENLSDVVQVSGGQWHTLAVKSDGTVWVWGSNQHFNLGQGNNQIIPNT
ncbi:MAG TPA: hypothetical protein VNT79_02025, partial [Phycisphaerae bacterium]|nr:hypothetical protein [Phycisphaerae bacterium]